MPRYILKSKFKGVVHKILDFRGQRLYEGSDGSLGNEAKRLVSKGSDDVAVVVKLRSRVVCTLCLCKSECWRMARLRRLRRVRRQLLLFFLV